MDGLLRTFLRLACLLTAVYSIFKKVVSIIIFLLLMDAFSLYFFWYRPNRPISGDASMPRFLDQEHLAEDSIVKLVPRRGRPKGSKNKPKVTPASTLPIFGDFSVAPVEPVASPVAPVTAIDKHHSARHDSFSFDDLVPRSADLLDRSSATVKKRAVSVQAQDPIVVELAESDVGVAHIPFRWILRQR